MKNKIYISSFIGLISSIFIWCVGSDTELGDVERAIRDMAIKGYGYSAELLDEQLNQVSTLRAQERERISMPAGPERKVNFKKVQKVLIEKFSQIKSKAWDDYMHNRLWWQIAYLKESGHTTGPLTGGGTTPSGGGPIFTGSPSSSTTTTLPPPPNVDKYPVLKDDSALQPIVDKIKSLRQSVSDELKKCGGGLGGCQGDKSASAPWMGYVRELYKLWDITIADASNLSSAIKTAADSAQDKGEFQSSLKEAVWLKASGTNYTEMKQLNQTISGLSFMSKLEQDTVIEHNIWRVIMGVKPLKADEKKVIAARKHSEYMAQNKVLTHEENVEGRRTFMERCAAEGTNCGGENAATGHTSATQVVRDGWLTSAGHHSNIINPSWGSMGLGFKEPYWWTAVFGP
jgi:uncharacterized protein YkwD